MGLAAGWTNRCGRKSPTVLIVTAKNLPVGGGHVFPWQRCSSRAAVELPWSSSVCRMGGGGWTAVCCRVCRTAVELAVVVAVVVDGCRVGAVGCAAAVSWALRVGLGGRVAGCVVVACAALVSPRASKTW